MKLLKLTEVTPPEQIVDVKGVAVTNGTGFTVITTETGLPEQELAVGVTLYVTVPAEDPVAKSVWIILEPLPAVPPEANA